MKQGHGKKGPLSHGMGQKSRPLPPHRVLQGVIVLVLLVVAASGILFHVFDTDIMEFLSGVSLCPFRALTRIPCPGCGMTRAMLSLGRFRIGEAVGHNPFSIPLFVAMVCYLFTGKAPSWLRHPWTGVSLVILVSGVWLARLWLL